MPYWELEHDILHRSDAAEETHYAVTAGVNDLAKRPKHDEHNAVLEELYKDDDD